MRDPTISVLVTQSFSLAELAAEEWRVVPIPAPSRVTYYVSSLGRFRSRWVDPAKPQEWRYPKLRASAGTGYLSVKIRHKNRAIHTLVLEAFIGPRPDGCQACHLNGSRIDARAVNLRWMNGIENAAHKREHGSQPCGALHYAAKLNEAQVREIRAQIAAGGMTFQALADRHGVTSSVISNIKTRKTWKHVA